MLAYPFAAHWMFDDDSFSSGLFLGTAIHETAQVAGAGLVYQQYYNDPQALDVATVAKLVRNLGMLIVILLMSIALSPKFNRQRRFTEVVDDDSIVRCGLRLHKCISNGRRLGRVSFRVHATQAMGLPH